MTFLTPLVCAVLTAQVAQVPPPRPASAISVEAATTITQGWALLAQGEVGAAADKASAALAASPRGAAALALAAEVEIARGGATAGLDFYERWLGNRTLEEPAVLRRLALALLKEVSLQSQNPAARFQALEALAADGDPTALAALQEGAGQDQLSNWRALAALGSQAAVAVLVKQLEGDGAGDATTLEALGKSRQASAIAAVSSKLKDPRPEVRAAAVDAVAALGGAAAVTSLRPMLKDPTAFVNVRAAKALFELNDMSGEPLLSSLLSPEFPEATRLMGVEGMAARPDARWMDAVRSLTNAASPEVRLSAAKLLTPFDPATAERTFDLLAGDSNPAIQEAASRRFAESTRDLTRLRQLLGHADRRTRISGAARLIELTR